MDGSTKAVAKRPTVTCEDCQSKYAVQPTHIGKRVKCKNCGHVFVAAASAAVATRKPMTAAGQSSSPIPRSIPKPQVVVKPLPAALQEPKPEVVFEKSKKPTFILVIVFAVALAIVSSVLGYKYWDDHHPTEEPQTNHQPQGMPQIAPIMGAPFSSSGYHDYADEQTLERRTANNLDMLTTEVLIYRDRHNGELPKSLDDLDLHYGGNDPRISPFDKSLGKHGYAYMPINLGPDIDRVLLYDIGELKKRGITHLVMSKYHQIRTMDREQLARQPNVSL